MPSTAPSDPGVTYTVTAVRYGTLTADRSDLFLNYGDYREPDRPAKLDYYFWVIENAERMIVLDTGFDARVGRRRGRTVHVDPRAALDALVTDVPDTVVVLSHAHYDHIGNVAHLRQATLLMDAAEYEFWVTRPRGLHLTDQLAEPVDLAALRSAREEGRLRLIDADLDLAPGVRVIAGHGHTPGQLMLAVDTVAGTLLLASDAVHLDEELERRMPFRHMCDLAASADTYAAIADLIAGGGAVRVIAGHQPGLIGTYPADPRLPDHSLVLTGDLPPERNRHVPPRTRHPLRDL